MSRRALFEVNGGGERGVVDGVRWKEALRVCPYFKEIDVITRAEGTTGIATGSNTGSGQGNEGVGGGGEGGT